MNRPTYRTMLAISKAAHLVAAEAVGLQERQDDPTVFGWLIHDTDRAIDALRSQDVNEATITAFVEMQTRILSDSQADEG